MVVPYSLMFPLIALAFVLLYRTNLAIPYFSSLTLANVLATLYWYLLPNGVARPKIEARNLHTRLLNFIYTHDGDANGFPSGHVFLTGISTYFLALEFPSFSGLLLILWIIVSISTVYTKQHYVIDILGGIVVTIIAIGVTRVLL